jgi:hypothetical protein
MWRWSRRIVILISVLLCIATIALRQRSIHTATDSVGYGYHYIAYTSSGQASLVVRRSFPTGGFWYESRDHQMQCPSIPAEFGLTIYPDSGGSATEFRLGLPLFMVAGIFSVPPLMGVVAVVLRRRRRDLSPSHGFELIPN